MKVYISGKISGLDYDEAFKKFERAEKELKPAMQAINPMRKVSEAENKTWKEYMIEDISILWDCDAIYLLSDWQDSKGARIEKAIAEELGLIIYFQEN